MTVLRSQQPWQVATNFVLAHERPQGASSPRWRYNRAYEQLAQTQGSLDQAEAMSLLQDVSQDNTIWSVVYNLSRGDTAVAVDRHYDQVHMFTLR